ncbi:MAG: hypothetical protein LBK58_02565 [Prevotellaceae bacterium]|jgi:hypothetical protein|nr:hypothetical protein [Prevotellaceae bacterium]
MKQINSFLKKKINRLILISSVCLFVMNSCYEFEELPNRIRSDYELAIPVIDTTVSIGDFVSFPLPDALPDLTTIPERTPIGMGELEFPFFIGEYSSSQKLKWIEPSIIIETKDLPSGTVINIKIYTKDDDGGEIYFWLPSDHTVTIGSGSIKIPETPNRITNVDQFRYSKKIFLDASITYPTATPVSKVIKDRVNIKFAIKFEIEADLSINL